MDDKTTPSSELSTPQRQALVSAVEEVVTQIRRTTRQGRHTVFSNAGKNKAPKEGQTPQSGLTEWNRFSRRHGPINFEYMERLCVSLGSFKWELHGFTRENKLNEIKSLYNDFKTSERIIKGRSGCIDKSLTEDIELLTRRGSGRFGFVEVANSLRSSLDSLRGSGQHIKVYHDTVDVIKKIDQDLRLAISVEDVTDICAFLLLPAAYGFFQSDQIIGQQLVISELNRAIEKGTSTYYAAFVQNTMLYQLETSQTRIGRRFRPDAPSLVFAKGTSYAAQALKAREASYSSHANGIVQHLTEDFGAECNAALEVLFQQASPHDNISYLDESAEQLLISEIESAKKENSEQAARIQLSLAESYLNDTNVKPDHQQNGIYKGFRLIKSVSEKTALEAKATLLLARFHAKNDNGIETAISLADRATDLYRRFGAETRISEVNLFKQHWEEKKRP